MSSPQYMGSWELCPLNTSLMYLFIPLDIRTEITVTELLRINEADICSHQIIIYVIECMQWNTAVIQRKFSLKSLAKDWKKTPLHVKSFRTCQKARRKIDYRHLPMHLLTASSLHQPSKSSPILPAIQGNISVSVSYKQKKCNTNK
jgi:hypothetical protein